MSGELMWRCFSNAEMVWMKVLVLLYSSSKVVVSETVTILPSPSASVEQYHPLTLYCSYVGNQRVVIVAWRTDTQEVAAFEPENDGTCILFYGSVDNSLYQFSCATDLTVTIKNVTEERHAEEWSCEVYEGKQFLESTSTSIFVQVSVKHVSITQPPGQVVMVEENQASTFTCVTSVERPRSTILWYIENDKEHANPLPGGSVSPKNNDTLTRTSGTISYSFHRGQTESRVYCTASNIEGKTTLSSNKILIQVLFNYGPDKASLNISTNTTVNENDGIAIRCFADCYPTCIYLWKRDTNQLAEEVLVLDPIQRSDAGVYACVVTNSANNSWTATSTVTIYVRYKASVVEFADVMKPSEKPTVINEHETLVLVCTVDSYPGSSITISRLNTLLEHAVDTYKLLLTLEDIRCSDTGIYVCSARNEYIDGSTESKQELQVFVRCAPKAVEKSTTEVFAKLSQSVVLNVSVHAYPIPTSYTWYKEIQNEWQLISPSNKVSISTEGLQSSLYIDNLTEDDFGLYGISAYNGINGNLLTKRFHVYLEGSPEMPVWFTCRLVSAISKSVLVSWTPATDGGFEQTFHVQYKQDTKTEWIEVTVKENQTTDRGNHSVILKNLSPGLTYEIRTFARNSKGSSPITEEWTVSISDEDKAQTTNTGAIIGGSMGGFVAGILVALLGLFLYWRFCRTNEIKTSTIQGGKGGDGTDMYYNVTAESIKDVRQGEDTLDQRQAKSPCTSGQPPNVYEELQSNRKEQPYEQIKQDVTR